MHVIGTAGHVDHGKSTLVEALTGIHPDRLKEERERQMTIDLGFAWLTLPDGSEVGVVDVPGHRDFIENMLAGVGGIDAVLFVVAADEGVMPQTREHLAILDLLKIPAGVIALTKADLVDEEWLGLVRADMEAILRGTALETAAVVPVSARTGSGLRDLRQALMAVLADRPPRPDLGRPRLSIDRVFSQAGFGTVVTGTLIDGGLAVGDEVAVLPGELTARVRGLQTHKTKLEQAVAGSRVAINLAGVEVGQLRRGQVVTRSGILRPTALIDVRLDHLADTPLDLKHNAQIKLFTGAAEVLGTVRLLEHEALAPGAAGWAQLVLAEPVVVVKGDRFVVRRPSPAATIGGGVVVDTHPGRRHRRRDAAVLARLETLARGTPGELVLQSLQVLGPAPLSEVLAHAGLELSRKAQVLAELQASGELVELEGDALVISRASWSRLQAELGQILAQYHRENPLRGGMPREEVKSRLAQALEATQRSRWTPKVFNSLMARITQAGQVVVNGNAVRRVDHEVQFTAAQRAAIGALLADFRRDPYNTPSAKDSAARVGDDVLAALVDQGQLVSVSPEVLFLPEVYQTMTERLLAYLATNGKVTVAEARDLFATSRKYALALLERLDAQGITRRVGDERVRRA
ncbi:MAG: selenocysteine-specific translation elongation factor [Anaerolineales bacterium]|nr:selenocysteine-specific translation elongation factor [Anaerolineales bacterium]